MTAKEIRELNEVYIQTLKNVKNPNVAIIDGVARGAMVVALHEIAAQLAELNANYVDFKATFTTNGAIDTCDRSDRG